MAGGYGIGDQGLSTVFNAQSWDDVKVMAGNTAEYLSQTFNSMSTTQQQLTMGILGLLGAAVAVNIAANMSGTQGTWGATLSKWVVGAAVAVMAASQMNPLIRDPSEPAPATLPAGNPRIDRDGDGRIDDFRYNRHGQLEPGSW